MAFPLRPVRNSQQIGLFGRKPSELFRGRSRSLDLLLHSVGKIAPVLLEQRCPNVAAASQRRRANLELRQVVRDHVPRSFGADVNVSLGSHPGVVVERAHGHDREPSPFIETRHRRAAYLAEPVRVELGFGQTILAEQLFTAHEAEAVERQQKVGRVGGAARLAAARAMAVRCSSRRCGDFEFNASAEAASFGARHTCRVTRSSPPDDTKLSCAT